MARIKPLSSIGEHVRRVYGRKAAIPPAVLSAVVYRFGGYEGYRCVDWQAVSRLVFVCAGNICRSAYAEWKARSLGLESASFGLSAADGAKPHLVAASVALRRGVDLSSHRSTPARAWARSTTDLLVAMEPAHARALRRLAAGTRPQVTLLGLWSAPIRPHLHDPYGLSESYFVTCFDYIDSAVETIAKQVSQRG